MAVIEASAAGGAWGTTTSWVGGVVPGEGDDVVFGVASGQISTAEQQKCRSVEWVEGAKNGFKLTSIGKILVGAGSIKADGFAWNNKAGIAINGVSGTSVQFTGTAAGAVKVFSGGGSFGESNFTVNIAGGSVLLMDKLITGTTAVLTLTAGTLDTQNHELEIGKLASSNSNIRVLTLGSSVVKIINTSATSISFGTTTNLTINRGTSQLELTDTGGGSRTVELGAVAWYDLIIHGPASGIGSLKFNTTGGTVHKLSLGAGLECTFHEGSAYAVESEFIAEGTEAQPITLHSSVAGKVWKLSKAAGVVELTDHLKIKDSTAEGGAEWYAGAHSSDEGSNTGWKFSGAPKPAILELNAAASTSSASLSLVNPAKLVLGAASSSSSASLAFGTAIRLILEAAAIESAARLSLHLPPEPPPPQQTASYIERLRERPPLRLNIDVETPLGAHYRLAWDDPNPANAPMGLSLSNVMPGGYERCSFTLERDTRLDYPDLAELSTVTVRGAGGDIAWQGRLEKTPDTGGFQEQVQPEAVGWQANLEDDSSAREIFNDGDLTHWTAATVQRKVQDIAANDPIIADPQIQPPGTTGIPTLATPMTSPWQSVNSRGEAWYDAQGIPIGAVQYAFKLNGNIGPADGNWTLKIVLSDDDLKTSADETVISPPGEGGSGTRAATKATRRWAALLQIYAPADASDGIVRTVLWQPVYVRGMHGLPGHGPAGALLASDVIAYALARWATKLAFSTGPEGTIKPTTQLIEQLAFLAPTTVAEMLKQAIRFELPDWAVWDGPTFYMNPRGEGGREWRARVGPAQLQQAGPQVSRLWNGVVVTYTDVSGTTRTVGPPGSGAEAEDPLLIDEDPENPLNEAGITRNAPLSMGTTTLAGATQVGAIFLREQATLETSGQATIVGHIEDQSGVLYPAWAIRSGDTVAFVDASDPSARRIVHANYDEPTRSCTIQLDQPPDSLTAILERLSASIGPLGFT